jgi:gliding motility-associated-like protein
MRILTLLILLSGFLIFKSQVNIVPNPSFEFTNSCPTGGAQWNVCTGWNNVNMNIGIGLWGTPDYFHACGSGGTMPPAVFAGTCNPQQGQAMMALVVYNQGYAEYREYLSTQLTCSMVPGNTYTVSFYLSNGTGIKSPWTVRNMGVHFSAAPLTQSGFNVINVVPQCEILTNVVSNTWTQYTFTVIPTAVWTHITIGNFRTDANNNVTLSFPNPGGPFSAYSNYFIDNIAVLAPSAPSNLVMTASVSQLTCGVLPSVTITNNNPTSSVNYQWLPGNYTSSVVSNIANGVYTVIGTYSNGCSSFSASTQFTVANSTTLQVGLTSTTICKGESVLLTPTISGGASSGYSYTWSPGNQQSPNITVNPPTSQVYSLLITDYNGCTGSASASVAVSAVSAAFTFSLGQCTGMLLTNNSSASAAGHYWSFGDNSSSSAVSPTHTYQTSGNYPLKLIVTDINGCTDTIVKYVTVDPIMHALFTPQVPLCDSVVLLSNNSINAVDFRWRFGDGSTSTLAQPGSHQYAVSGNYSIWLTTKAANGCLDSLKKDVLVIKTSKALFEINSVPCRKTITLVNGSLFNATNYWQFDTGDTSSAFQPSYTYSANGIYSITLVINAATSCSSTITKTVAVTEDLPSSFKFLTNNCTGLVTFTNTSASSSGALWNFGDGSTGGHDTTAHIYAQPGIYRVTLLSSPDKSCAVGSEIDVNVDFEEVIADFDFTVVDKDTYTTAFLNLSRNATSYYWDFGTGVTSRAIEPKTRFESYGTQFVCLVASNGKHCKDTTCKVIMIEGDWTLYIPDTFTPNGDNTNDAFFALGTNISNFKMEIYNRWGTCVFTGDGIDMGWDGTFKAAPVGQDVFTWKVRFEDSENKIHSLTGRVAVIR